MKVRVDKWLWAIRVCKTRSVANDACAKGRVRVNGEVAKPATKVDVGDTVEIRRRDRLVIVELVDPIEKRVSAALAAACYVDHSPPPPEVSSPLDGILPVLDAGRRERGAGRPTKRDRRQLQQLKNQQEREY